MVHIQYQCQIYSLSREGGSSEMRKLKKAKSKKIFLRTMIIGVIGSYNFICKKSWVVRPKDSRLQEEPILNFNPQFYIKDGNESCLLCFLQL